MFCNRIASDDVNSLLMTKLRCCPDSERLAKQLSKPQWENFCLANRLLTGYGLHFSLKSSVKPPSLNATAVAIYIPLRLYNIQHVQCLLCYTKVPIRVITRTARSLIGLYAGCAPTDIKKRLYLLFLQNLCILFSWLRPLALSDHIVYGRFAIEPDSF